MDFISIPLEQLEISPFNSRATVSRAEIDEMKASIRAHGLLNGLTVCAKEQPSKKSRHTPPRMYQVIAGRRRLTALQELHAARDPKALKYIPCLLGDDANAYERSVAENVVRHNMHPVDEFEAFATLAAADKANTPAKIALRFGVSEKHVLGRLKLARVHKDILAAFRKGDLTLEKVMAFTLCEDRKKQVAAFEQMDSYYDEPDDIRRALTDQLVETQSALVKYVTLAAYKKGGGPVQEDLFSEHTYLEDKTLLKKLALDKFASTATKLKADGWGWVEFHMEGSLWDRQRGMTLIGEVPRKEARGALGVIVALDTRGGETLSKGWLKKSDAADFRKVAPAIAKSFQLKPGRQEGASSKSVDQAISAQRRQVMQLAIAKAPPALIFSLVAYIAARHLLSPLGDVLRHGPRIAFNSRAAGDDFPLSQASRELGQLNSRLERGWLSEKTESARWLAFSRLPASDRERILAYCVAMTVSDSAPEQRAADLTETVLQELSVRVCDHWRPTRENYLELVTAQQLLDIGRELIGAKWREDWKNAKKPQLVAELHEIFHNPDKSGGSSDLQRRIFEWLPAGMAFKLPASPSVQEKKHAKG